ncbi:sterol 24-C-methyltransferase [Aureococcus anophagefferens]|nr:sterol 24-C-methyltransferase [Aureococcus anophagefferens]
MQARLCDALRAAQSNPAAAAGGLCAVAMVAPICANGLKLTVRFLSSLSTSKKHGRIDGYNKLQEGDDAGERNTEYAALVDSYYDLATEFYESTAATRLCASEGVAHLAKSVQGDFMALPFPEASFDGVYAIEATCHAPDRAKCYGEIYRVLKPGATFACYEWCLTDAYDGSERHKKLKKDIEARDCAADGMLDGGDPWHMPLVPSWHPLKWPRFQFNPVMYFLMPKILSFFELIRLVPAGTSKTQVMLQAGGVGCAEGGITGAFTPMWLMVAKKPLK